MEKSGNHLSKSNNKGPKHGQDYTKNIIWAMDFTHKSSIIWNTSEIIEIRLLYKEADDSFLLEITNVCTTRRNQKPACTQCALVRRRSSKRHEPGLNQYFPALASVEHFRSSRLSKPVPQSGGTNPFKNTRAKHHMPLKIIDSSTLLLNLTNHKWAKFRKTKAGVKLHLRLVFMERHILSRKGSDDFCQSP